MCTAGQNSQEYRLKYWATCSSVRSFAHSLAHGTVNDLMAFFSVFFSILNHSDMVLDNKSIFSIIINSPKWSAKMWCHHKLPRKEWQWEPLGTGVRWIYMPTSTYSLAAYMESANWENTPFTITLNCRDNSFLDFFLFNVIFKRFFTSLFHSKAIHFFLQTTEVNRSSLIIRLV